MSTRRQCNYAYRHGVRYNVAVSSTGLSPIVLPLLLAAVMMLSATASVAQQAPPPGAEMYAVPHLFALSTATTTRQFGMGATTTCVEDVGFPNPAFAGTLNHSKAGLRHSCTDFGAGLKLRGTQAWYALPLGENEGMQILGFRLDSNRGGLAVPGLQLETEETDVAVHYGRRLSDQWLVGAGLAPVLETTTRLFDPAGNQLARWDSKASYGLRIGALYRHEWEGHAGLVVDYYREDVTFRPPVPGAPSQDFGFDSTTIALGASGRISEGVLGVIEWMQLKSQSGDLESVSAGWKLGFEADADPGVRVRAGLNAGAPTLGVGYSRDEWVVNYAFISNWNDDEVGELLGRSDTHQLEVACYW